MELNLVCVCFISLYLLVASASCDGPIPGELNYPCQTVGDCRKFGYVCKDGTCQCDKWYIPGKSNRTCVGGVLQACKYDVDCIEGAYCMEQKLCKCMDPDVICSNNGMSCERSSGESGSPKSRGVADLRQTRAISLTFLVIGVIRNMHS